MNKPLRTFISGSSSLPSFSFCLLTCFSSFCVLHNIDWIITKRPICSRSFPRLSMLNLLSPVSPWAGILPSFDARRIISWVEENDSFSIIKKGKGKKKKERAKCFELTEQNILIELIRKTAPQKTTKYSHEMAKFIRLWIWGVDAEGRLKSGAETRNKANSSCSRKGVIFTNRA